MSENQLMIEYWNRQAGCGWVLHQDEMDKTIRPFGEAVMDLARPRAGERILDFGCGCGDTTLALADRVSDATVVGADISGPMLRRARERAGARPHVGFVRADAAAPPFPPGTFDLLFSRFGSMFFADPRSAFTQLRAVGRRLALVCWRTIPENPWVGAVVGAVASLAPPPPFDPEAPGPFAFADPGRLRHILDGAGWRDVQIAPFDHPMRYASLTTVDAAVEFFMRLGPASRIVATLDEAGKAQARVRLSEALAPHLSAGGPEFAGAAWLVTAA